MQIKSCKTAGKYQREPTQTAAVRSRRGSGDLETLKVASGISWGSICNKNQKTVDYNYFATMLSGIFHKYQFTEE